QEAIRIDPDETRGYGDAAAGYLGLNRPEEAKAVLHAGLQRNPAFLSMHDGLANIAYAQGDSAEMEKEEAFIHGQADLEMNASSRHGDIAASHGQLHKAVESYEKGREIANRIQLKDLEAFYILSEAYAAAMFGDGRKAIQTANTALALAPSYNLKLYAAITLAFAGDEKKALAAASQAASE